MPRPGWLVAVVLLCCAAPVGAAQPVALARTSEFVLHSAATDRDYLIQVAAPASPPPAGGYPVLYVLDGNAYWPLVRLAHQMFARQGPHAPPEPLLIVGIGYPGVERFEFDARAQDYTPAAPQHTGYRQRKDRSYGGAAQFLTFIEQQLKPAIGAHYPVDAGRQSILGHSFGGLFVLYTLLQRPAAFDFYAAISPSLWWGEGYIARALDAAAPDAGVNGRCLFIGVGQLEQTPRAGKHGTTRGKRVRDRHMVGSARQLAQQLRQAYPSLRQTFAAFPGERHGTVMWPAVRRVLDYRKRCQAPATQADASS